MAQKTASKQTAEIDPIESAHSVSEQCGFVCHVALGVLTVTYTPWILATYSDTTDRNNTTTESARDGAFLWTLAIPTALVGLFFAAPILYGVINSFSAAKTDSIHTIADAHSMMSLLPKTPSDQSSSETFERDEGDSDGDLPEIFDIDVSIINNQVWAQTMK